MVSRGQIERVTINSLNVYRVLYKHSEKYVERIYSKEKAPLSVLDFVDECKKPVLYNDTKIYFKKG